MNNFLTEKEIEKLEEDDIRKEAEKIKRLETAVEAVEGKCGEEDFVNLLYEILGNDCHDAYWNIRDLLKERGKDV